jgi:hypothetical protein
MKCTKAATTWIVALTVVLGAAAVGVRSAAGTSVAPWITFKSETEHLSVLMPGTPQAREKHNKSFVGDITTVEHSAKEGLDTYTVDYTTLPGFAISFSGTDGIYEHAKGHLGSSLDMRHFKGRATYQGQGQRGQDWQSDKVSDCQT